MPKMDISKIPGQQHSVNLDGVAQYGEVGIT